MTQFKRTLVAEDGVAKIRSEVLGDNTGQFGPYDTGVLVKYSGNTMAQVAADDEIVGQVTAVETATVNGGYSYGAVKQSHRIEAVAGADADTNALAVGDLVVADAQTALKGQNSTTQGVELGKVKKGSPAIFKWMVIAIESVGAAGEKVLLERV